MGTQINQPGSQQCPLCGFQFDASQAACSGCALVHGCSMLKCPNCHYEFVGESKIVQWFLNLFKKGDASCHTKSPKN